MRKDLEIYNEANGWILSSVGLNGRLGNPFSSDSADWREEVLRGTLIPVTLVQDDAFIVRVVLDEEPTDQEKAEAYDRFEALLCVPDGKLLIAGGSEYTEEQDTDTLADFIEVVKIPRGVYTVAVYTYYHSPNVAVQNQENREDFFRRTRPGRRPPKWVRGDKEETEYIGFLVHLTPTSAGAPNPIPLGEDGWVPERVQFQRPDLCPLGLVAKRLKRKEKPYRQTGLIFRFPVLEQTDPLELSAVSGEPVSLPAKDIVLAHWLGFLTGETHPALRIRPAEEWNPDWPGFLRGVQETKTEDGWRIEIEGMNARWTPFFHMRLVGELLGSLPDGSEVEAAWASRTGNAVEGVLRFTGPVAAGVWRIEKSFPAFEGSTLLRMLAFAQTAETAQGFVMQDEDERDRLANHCRTQDFFFKKTPPILEGLKLIAPEPFLNYFLAAHIFADRFRGILPILPWTE